MVTALKYKITVIYKNGDKTIKLFGDPKEAIEFYEFQKKLIQNNHDHIDSVLIEPTKDQ